MTDKVGTGSRDGQEGEDGAGWGRRGQTDIPGWDGLSLGVPRAWVSTEGKGRRQ